jgi:hypothetical protein
MGGVWTTAVRLPQVRQAPGVPSPADLHALAVEQGGTFTVEQAGTCGWSPREVRAALERKEWLRLQPGILVDRAWRESLTPEARHVVDLRARLGFRAEGWHAARRSALVVHGLPFIGSPPSVPQLVRDKSAPALRGHSRHERIAPLPPTDREHREVPVTSAARAVVDVARGECFRNAVVATDGALRAGVTHQELVAVLERARRWPGVVAARAAIAFGDPRAETPLESISRAALHALGLPAPEPQVEIWYRGELVARVDFLWRDQRVVGEADGRAKYASVEDLYREKRREERLRDLGFEVVRWDWDSAYRPGPPLAAAVERSLQRGRLNTVLPGVLLRSTSPLSAAA